MSDTPKRKPFPVDKLPEMMDVLADHKETNSNEEEVLRSAATRLRDLERENAELREQLRSEKLAHKHNLASVNKLLKREKERGDMWYKSSEKHVRGTEYLVERLVRLSKCARDMLSCFTDQDVKVTDERVDAWRAEIENHTRTELEP